MAVAKENSCVHTVQRYGRNESQNKANEPDADSYSRWADGLPQTQMGFGDAALAWRGRTPRNYGSRSFHCCIIASVDLFVFIGHGAKLDRRLGTGEFENFTMI
jgi:hypothetical protein